MDLIRRSPPDVLFLDVKMPGMSGFELLEQLDSVPQVMFTATYDEFALKAFEVSALDYVVKPVVPARLAAAIAKLRPPAAPGRLERVFVKEGGRCWLVPTTNIFLLKSEGNYTRVHFSTERPWVPRSLAALERRLDPAMFFRAGRSQIVNLRWVKGIEPGPGGNIMVRLRGGSTVAMSRRQSARLRAALSF